MENPSSYNVEHDAEQHQFVIHLDGGNAKLSYSPGSDAWDFYYVFVPPSHRGQGLAAVLTKAAFEYARENALRVIPGCPYVRDQFLQRHPEYQELVARP